MFHNGVYHLFYQYNPYAAVWGNISWGPSVSYNLVVWIHLEPAINLSEAYDIKGCWSGSATALARGSKPVILYTGENLLGQQVQNLAMPKDLSDPLLREWVNSSHNPLMIPVDGIDPNLFRDPTTARQISDGTWRVLVGSEIDGHGAALLYSSRDFITWERGRRPLHLSSRTGMWECPDFYPISTNADGVDVRHGLKASFNDHDYYIVGSYDSRTDGFSVDVDFMDDMVQLRYDYGVFYASKSFFDGGKNRRVLWGWVTEAGDFGGVFFFKFLKADGDFTLLSKGKVKCEEIEDKVIWITGASRGIGEVLAKQLASLGAKLIISARNEVELQRVKKELTGKHAPDEVVILPLDLSRGEEHLAEAVQVAESLFGGAGVDYVFHNAAYERPKSLALDVTEESLKATFDVNVLGPISLTRLLSPHMLKRGRGHFVVMSSAAGKTPAPGQAVYSASKFAVNGYFHTLRSELCRRGIKVTIVCPGPVKTATTSDSSSSQDKASSEKRVSSERCAELTIIAASHGLKEAWISYQPVLAVMYLVQYAPAVGYWLMDKIGEKRIAAAAQKGNTYSLGLLFGKEKAS